MRTVIIGILFLLLWPTIGLGGYHRSYPHAPYAYSPRYHSSSYHHNYHDDWIVPLAVVGGVLGLVALTQMAAPPPPPLPPQRLCRDTYNYYDEFGRFRYSRYVDRPCY